MSRYYIQKHRSQYEAKASAITRSSGCTWTSAANGIAASTGGRETPSPDQVHAKVARREETSPATPGWSMPDVDKACARLGIPFDVRSGSGWRKLESLHNAGYYLIVQGDSDRFSDATCSGKFDGDHAIGVHPEEDARGWWWIDDPICKTGRWEHPNTIRRYAEDLAPRCWFGVFLKRVPLDR